MRERPVDFRINMQSPLARGLVFAGLGQHPGATLFHDESPSKMHGTLTGYSGAGDLPGDRWQWDQSLRRFTLSGDGADDCVTLPATGPLTGIAPPYSASVWVYSASYAQSGIIGNIYGATPWAFGPYVVESAVMLGTAACMKGLALSEITAGIWQHWCVVWLATNSLQFFLSGVEKSLSARNYWGTSNLNRLLSRSGQRFFGGQIADFMVFNRALTPDEIKCLADPSNVDLRIGSTPLIESIRKYWPVGPASGEAPTGNRRRRVMIAA